MYFGREATLGIRVVLKQYLVKAKKLFFTEIKILSLLEKLRDEQSGTKLKQVLNKNSDLKGLPQLLGYKVNRKYSEILMTHGGSAINSWIALNKVPTRRTDFAADMLRQIITAL